MNADVPLLRKVSNVGDAGTSGTNLKENGPLLAKVPAGWLEGQKRKVNN